MFSDELAKENIVQKNFPDLSVRHLGHHHLLDPEISNVIDFMEFPFDVCKLLFMVM